MGIERLFDAELEVLNIGLESFLETLLRIGVQVRQVEPDYTEHDEERHQ